MRIHLIEKVMKTGFCIIGAWSLVGITAEAYPALAIQEPGVSYTFPATFNAFLPPVTEGEVVSPAAPEIAEWTRSNEPGDTMVLTGSRISSFSGADAGRDTRFVFFGQSSVPSAVNNGMIQRLDGQQCALQLPAALQDNEMYLLWPGNSNGYGKPVAINKAEVWWVGPDQAASGETFSVYGRNLQLGDGKCHLYIQELNRWIESSSASPYKADFVLPSGIGNKTYTVWAHNGHGGKYGWAQSRKLEVVSKVNWSGTTFNVKNYGAKGDGVTDDFNAISAAINAAASKPYSTVYFPAGTYAVAGRLPMAHKSKIRYMGAGMDQTTITLHPNHVSSASPGFLVYNCSNNSEYRDMTLQANQYGGDNIFYIRGQHHVNCENVRFTQLKSPSTEIITGVVDIHQTSYVSFKNCEFILTGRLFLGGADQAVVDGCDFYGLNDNNLLINSYGANQIAIINCTAQSYDNSDPSNGFGWCKGRVFHSDGGWGSTCKIYFGGNTTKDMTPRYDPAYGWFDSGQVDQNSGEAFMCENENVLWRASPASAAGKSITLPGIAGSYVGNIVAIVSGKGFGQSREIVSVNTATGEATVDEPWNVVPDQTSVASIGTFTRQMIVHGNYFDGTPRAISDTVNNRNIAVAGVEPYGGAMDWIVAENTFHELRGGLALFSRYKDNVQNTSDYCVMPHYFNTYVNNSFVSCRTAIGLTVDKKAQGSGGLIGDVATFGNMFRGNRMTNTVSMAIRASTVSSTAVIAMSVFDRNALHSLRSFVSGDDGQKNHVWLKNKFYGSNSSVGLTIAASDRPVLRENAFNNFSTKYGGALPGATLELPERVITLSGNSPDKLIPICNSGTSVLSWTAKVKTTTATWLTLESASGTVADENSTGQLKVSINTASLPSVNAEAVIEITKVGGETKQITIVYESNPDAPAPALQSLKISGTSEIGEGDWSEYICTAYYSDGSSRQVNATWSVTSPSFIGSSGWLEAAIVDGDQTISVSASYGGISASKAVTINDLSPALVSLLVNGADDLNEGDWSEYICTAYYADGSNRQVDATWSVTSPSFISGSGWLEAAIVDGDQAISVSASYGGISASKAVTINDLSAAPVSLLVEGVDHVNEGDWSEYICTAYYSDGSSRRVDATWSVTSPSFIGSSGWLEAAIVDEDQFITVSAHYLDLSISKSVKIKNMGTVPVSLEIQGSQDVEEESRQLYTCFANYPDGSRSQVIPNWSLYDSEFQITASGLFNAGLVDADRVVRITAVYEGVVAELDVLVQSMDEIVYPLSGFEGQWLDCYLWDQTALEYTSLGVGYEPDELVVNGLDPTHDYWLGIRKYEASSDSWPLIHGCWIEQSNEVF